MKIPTFPLGRTPIPPPPLVTILLQGFDTYVSAGPPKVPTWDFPDVPCAVNITTARRAKAQHYAAAVSRHDHASHRRQA